MTLTKRRADGSEYTVPTDLTFFRVEFDEQEADAAAKFKAVYGDEPREINCLLPFDDISLCFDPFCEGYTAGRMVARSDGEYFLYLTDQQGNVVVMNGAHVKTGEKVPHKDNLWGEGTKAVKCKPVGRLKVIIPELRRAAYMVVHTTSIHDVANISDQLRAISQLRNGHIVGIPLVLRRRPKEISVPGDKGGPRRRLTKWMLSIEADPAWVEKMLTAMGQAALPGAEKLLLPKPQADEIPEQMDSEEDDHIDAEFEDAAQEPDSSPIPPINVKTTPEAIKEAIPGAVVTPIPSTETAADWHSLIDVPAPQYTPPLPLPPAYTREDAARDLEADKAKQAAAPKKEADAMPTIGKNTTLFWSVCFTNLGLKRGDVLKHLEANAGDYDKTLADLWPK